MGEDCFCLHMACAHESDHYREKQHTVQSDIFYFPAVKNTKLNRDESLSCRNIPTKD